MSTEANSAIARRVFDDLFSQGKFDAADEIYAPDHTSHDPQAPGVNGPEAMKHYIGMYRAAFPDLRVSLDDVIAEGDRVVIRWTARGTQQGELMGVPPTGKQIVVTGINIFRVSDGQIHEEWVNWDTLGLLQQLGIAPEIFVSSSKRPGTCPGEIGTSFRTLSEDSGTVGLLQLRVRNGAMEPIPQF